MLIGISIAVIHAYVARRTTGANPELVSEQASAAAETRQELSISHLSRGDLGASFVWWMFFHNAALNFERSQNMGFGGAMAMILSKLYPLAEDRAAALRRHLTLFAAEPAAGAFVLGATAALEERRAAGEPIGEAEFVGAKTGAMTLLGTLGDAVVTGILATLFAAFGAALARAGNLLGPFVFVAVMSLAFVALAWVMFRAGYAQMRRWASWASQNDWLPAALFGALRVGVFALGALIVNVGRATPVSITPVLQIDAARIPLQNIVDGVLPGALPLLITLAMWYLMRYRKTQSMTLLGLCILAAFIVAAIMRLVHWI
jgi:PTS system mannose-specific IID component